MRNWPVVVVLFCFPPKHCYILIFPLERASNLKGFYFVIRSAVTKILL